MTTAGHDPTDRSANRLVRVAGPVAAWVVAVGGIVAALLFDERLRDLGRDDLVTFAPEIVVVIAGMASALVVGTALVVRRPEHPVGWLFLALGASIGAAGALDGYARVGAVAEPGSLPAAALAAHLGDVMFVPWMVIIAMVLQLTPNGTALTPRWRRAASLTVWAGATAMAGTLLGDRELEPPMTGVSNPLHVSALDPLTMVAAMVGTFGVGVGLVVGGASLVVRHRRAVGIERRQLMWLALVAVPLPVVVVAAFVAAWTEHPAPMLIASAGFIAAVPIAAGLAISRARLFDVDRILSRALAYVLLTVLLVVVYATVVVAVGRMLSSIDDGSTIAAVVATLVAVSLAAPVRGWLQDALDRRFNRRRFDAVRIVESQLASSSADSIERTLSDAVADPSLTVAYWHDDRSMWTVADGTAPNDTAGAPSVQVTRNGRVIARVSHAPTTAAEVVHAAAAAATAELDNARLRAAISLQLVEVNESRARIAAAQASERRRIERDLHDGAQQRLLAVALRLRAASLNGSSAVMHDELEHAVGEVQAAVLDLRDLANGLQPAELSGGLAVALESLAVRSPIRTSVVAVGERFDADAESCAWFVACEALANAHKHSGAESVTIELRRSGEWFELTVTDDGIGGADLAGSGLQGIGDRVAALGGTLVVNGQVGAGTVVQARLPCGL